MTKPYTRVGVLCRVQPPHLGHKRLFKHALAISDNVRIIIGSADTPRNTVNPFTYLERCEMVKAMLTEEEISRITFVPLNDNLYNHGAWKSDITKKMNDGFTDDPSRLALLSSDKDGDDKSREKWLPGLNHISMNAGEVIHATDIRKAYLEHYAMFRKEFSKCLDPEVLCILERILSTDVYSYLQGEQASVNAYKEPYKLAKERGIIKYDPTFNTVDNVVICANHILLVKRRDSPGKGLWALPGGFLEQDETQFDGAMRELKEETCIDIPPAILRSNVVFDTTFDHPKRSQIGRLITQAFCFSIPPQNVSAKNQKVRSESFLPIVQGNDDAEVAKWFPIEEFENMRNVLHDDHWYIGTDAIAGLARTRQSRYNS